MRFSLHSLLFTQRFFKSWHYLFFLFLFHGSASALELLMINPINVGNPHWDKAQHLAETAAKQLGINLKVIHADKIKRSNYAALTHYLKAGNPKPDGVFFLVHPAEDAVALFEHLEQLQIPFINLENTLSPEIMEQLQAPGQRFKYWKATKLFNDYQSGYVLADNLLKQAEKRFGNKVQIVGLSGNFTETSKQRNQGLIDALKSYPSAKLLQITHTNWEQRRGYEQAKKLLKRYPELNVIWAASDNGALGAHQALLEAGKRPGLDVLIGGIDWRDDAFPLIMKEEYNVSVGGQVLAATSALVHLYDLANGIDPKKLKSLNQLPIVSVELNQKPLSKKLMEAKWDDIDFKLMSLKHNSNAKDCLNLADLLLKRTD